MNNELNELLGIDPVNNPEGEPAEEWVICFQCNGTGIDPCLPDRQCWQCKGSGETLRG